MTPTTAIKRNTFRIPKDEIAWVRGFDSEGTLCYIITSNKMRDKYFLYSHENEEWKRIAKARSPSSFEGRVKIR